MKTRSFASGRNFRFRGHRAQALERDGGACRYCGDPATCADHVVPFAFGGRNDLENLVAACHACNTVAGDLVFDSFEDKLAYVRARRGLEGEAPAIALEDGRIPWDGCACIACDPNHAAVWAAALAKIPRK